MSSLSSIVNVSITSEGRGVSRKSFGIPLVIGVHTAYADLVRTYDMGTARADLVADGIAVGTPIHNTVSALASNSPKTQTVAVGKLVSPYTHITTLTVLAAATTENKVLSFNVVAPDGGATTAISYTVGAAETTTTVASAISTLIDAITDISSANTGPSITNTADNTNETWYITDLNVNDFNLVDTTADSSLVTDLTAIDALYSDWYGLILADPNSKARALALAANIETQERIFGVTSHDGENGVTGSVLSTMYALNAASYYRTYCIYSGGQTAPAAATWMGNMFPRDPGSATWAYKALSGVTVDVLTSTFVTQVKATKGNWYESLASLPVTQEGRMASAEWIDVIRGRDWLVARLRERVANLLVNSPKVPYTDPGAEQVGKEVTAQIREGIAQGYLAAEPEFTVTVPKVTDVSAANKNNRILPDVAFECTLAGAIHAVAISGVIKV